VPFYYAHDLLMSCTLEKRPMFKKRASLIFAAAIMTLVVSGTVPLPALGPADVEAQGGCQTFQETGKSVCGRFLEYWQTNGGLAQQGFPISGELNEVSDLDGKPYVVQYFERAVFEKHPEKAAPYDVLLSQLGTFEYKRKYPNGAREQQASKEPGARAFSETGHTVGGKFLEYWNTHGGLAQQGYPISEEFTEVSDLNGQSYKVQYFERAVFEFHPENAPPYDILLSQLGTFRYKVKSAPTPTRTATRAVPTATATAQATSTPTPQSDEVVHVRPFAEEYPWLQEVRVKGRSLDENRQLDFTSRDTMKNVIDQIVLGFEHKTGRRPDANGYIEGVTMPRVIGMATNGPFANWSVLAPTAPMRAGFKKIRVERVSTLPPGAPELHGGASENWFSIFNNGEELLFLFDTRVPLLSAPNRRSFGDVSAVVRSTILLSVYIDESPNYGAQQGTNFMYTLGYRARDEDVPPLTKVLFYTHDGVRYTSSAFGFRP
jgi:hypothetical protein